MRCYTIDHRGIRCREGKIILGESGRGRRLVSVPVPAHAVYASDRDPTGDPALLLECSGPLDEVLLRIPDQSGFRGSWRLRAARPDSEWDAIVADPNTRPADECPAEHTPGVAIVAQGWCAQGDAGRMGGGPDMLLTLRPDAPVEIVRTGRLYGSPSVVRLEVVDGAIVTSDPRSDAESRAAAARLAEGGR